MLVPHGREDAKLCQRRRATDQLQNAVILVRLEAVFGHQLRRNLYVISDHAVWLNQNRARVHCHSHMALWLFAHKCSQFRAQIRLARLGLGDRCLGLDAQRLQDCVLANPAGQIEPVERCRRQAGLPDMDDGSRFRILHPFDVPRGGDGWLNIRIRSSLADRSTMALCDFSPAVIRNDASGGVGQARCHPAEPRRFGLLRRQARSVSPA
jgi:hypothetical protein